MWVSPLAFLFAEFLYHSGFSPFLILVASGSRRLALGIWLLASGSWRLALGSWPLVVFLQNICAIPALHHFGLVGIDFWHLASSVWLLALFLASGSCLLVVFVFELSTTRVAM